MILNQPIIKCLTPIAMVQSSKLNINFNYDLLNGTKIIHIEPRKIYISKTDDLLSICYFRTLFRYLVFFDFFSLNICIHTFWAIDEKWLYNIGSEHGTTIQIVKNTRSMTFLHAICPAVWICHFPLNYVHEIVFVLIQSCDFTKQETQTNKQANTLTLNCTDDFM